MNDLRCWPMPGHACLDHAGDRLENFDVVVLVTDLVDPIVADLRVDVRHCLQNVQDIEAHVTHLVLNPGHFS